ncbi:hypothetical protein AF332_08745 [Sporosarcina globispora]|uniref:Uncharacterized protein n=1 Tax=Sporosarcina globispora TaxID=1459 RepID=A0A0M0GAK4_SPOGL|nr:hypothetical protein [Sporosarcina globispora]KON86884.1 hypothetical protein AF332_08745 [Sporosarcina globispora]
MRYKGFDEVVSVMQEDQMVEFELAIAAYYYPELEELRKELPPMDTQGISNKRNPLSSFSNWKLSMMKIHLYQNMKRGLE